MAAERAWSLLESVNDWIRHAEGKATAIMAFIGAVTAAVVIVAPPRADVSVLQGWVMAALGTSTVFTWALAAAVLRPRVRARKKSPNRCPKKSPNPLFFGDIASKYASPAHHYRDLRRTLSDHNLYTEHVAQQVNANACVAAQKFRLVTWATRLLFLSVALLILLVALLWWDLDSLSALADTVVA